MYIGEGSGTLLQYSCLENPMDGGAWWAAVHGVTKSWTQLTSLSLFTFMHWRRKWQPTPVFLPGESQGRGSLYILITYIILPYVSMFLHYAYFFSEPVYVYWTYFV